MSPIKGSKDEDVVTEIVAEFLCNHPGKVFINTKSVYNECKDVFIALAPEFWKYTPKYKKTMISKTLSKLGSKQSANHLAPYHINRVAVNQTVINLKKSHTVMPLGCKSIS